MSLPIRKITSVSTDTDSISRFGKFGRFGRCGLIYTPVASGIVSTAQEANVAILEVALLIRSYWGPGYGLYSCAGAYS